MAQSPDSFAIIRASMRKFLKPALWTALVLVALLDVMLLIGYRTPRDHVASRTLVSKQTPQAIWTVINDHANEPSWRPGLKKIERMWDGHGLEVWRETYSNGDTLSFATTEFQPPQRLVRVITDEDLPFGGRWEYQILPGKDGGSRVTITEYGYVRPPLYRFVSKYVIGHAYQIDRYLKGLAAKLGGPAQIS